MLSKLFVPQHKYGKRGFLLSHKTLISYAFFILSLLFSVYLIKLSFPSVLGYATNVYIEDLLKDTNEVRQKAGLPPLSLNPKLERASEAKAQHMFKYDYWAHTSPSGVEPWDFVIGSGYNYEYAGENLAVDFNDSQKVVDAWYASPTHRANLLNDKYTEVGFAVVNGELQGRKTTLVVQMFGKPKKGLLGLNRDSDRIPEEVEKMLASVQIPPERKLARDTSSPAEEVYGSVLNADIVFHASKYLAITIGSFLLVIFAIEEYYRRKLGIFRISGHAVLHILLLLLAIFGIWYTNVGIVL